MERLTLSALVALFGIGTLYLVVSVVLPILHSIQHAIAALP